MNIYSAIRNLKNGQAVKPSNWRGYVKREDSAATDPAYNPDKTDAYAAGAIVLYNGSRYAARDVVDPDVTSGKIGPFVSSKWTRIDFDHDLTFVDAEDGDPTPNPSAVYHGTVTVSGVSYARTGPAAPVDMPDSELFTAILSDAWESGSAADYETQRTGGGGRW